MHAQAKRVFMAASFARSSYLEIFQLFRHQALTTQQSSPRTPSFLSRQFHQTRPKRQTKVDDEVIKTFKASRRSTPAPSRSGRWRTDLASIPSQLATTFWEIYKQSPVSFKGGRRAAGSIIRLFRYTGRYIKKNILCRSFRPQNV